MQALLHGCLQSHSAGEQHSSLTPAPLTRHAQGSQLTHSEYLAQHGKVRILKRYWLMKLRQIDKNRYRKHYKIVFSAIVIALIVISLVSSTLLISWLGSPDESHFILNLTGVVVAALLVLYALYRYREHPFMDELVYVWNLKKQLNRIYRKQHKIEPLIEDDNLDAMVIMNYMYQGSKQLYELDDNTITLDDLAIKTRHLNTKLEEKELKLTTDDYTSGLLAQF